MELKGWWVSFPLDEDQVIALYEKRGPREPFHSEIQSQADLERPPSGKFAIHALVLTFGILADNIPRILRQNGLSGDFRRLAIRRNGDRAGR